MVFSDIVVSHPEYAVVAKRFTDPGRFHEVVAYVDPGRRASTVFSASRSQEAVQGSPEASPEELHAFREIVASLILLPTRRPE